MFNKTQRKQDYRPGPGDYNAAKQTLAGALTVSAAKTMGVAPVGLPGCGWLRKDRSWFVHVVASSLQTQRTAVLRQSSACSSSLRGL